MTQVISTIEKGYNEYATYWHTNPTWTTDHFVEQIIQERKDIGPGLLVVYRGYKNTEATRADWQLIFEIEANSAITLTFKNDD